MFLHTHNPEGRGVSLERRSELSGGWCIAQGDIAALSRPTFQFVGPHLGLEAETLRLAVQSPADCQNLLTRLSRAVIFFVCSAVQTRAAAELFLKIPDKSV